MIPYIDRAEQAAVYRMTSAQCYRWIESVIGRQGVPPCSVPDVAQEVVIAYWQTRGVAYWEDPQPQPSLLHALIERKVASYWREHYLERKVFSILCQLSDALEETDVQSIATTHMETVELSQPLDSESRNLLALRLEYEMRWQEIAQQLGVSTSTAYQRFQKVLQTIREHLEASDEKNASPNDISIREKAHNGEGVKHDTPSVYGQHCSDPDVGEPNGSSQHREKHRRGGVACALRHSGTVLEAADAEKPSCLATL